MSPEEKAAWRRFADALDRFDGTGLGAGEMRVVVGTRNDKPLCRFCAAGAVMRVLHPSEEWSQLDEWKVFDEEIERAMHVMILSDVTETNDEFRNSDNSASIRRDRLAYMRAYGRLRAKGKSRSDARDGAEDVLSSTHPTAAKGAGR